MERYWRNKRTGGYWVASPGSFWDANPQTDVESITYEQYMAGIGKQPASAPPTGAGEGLGEPSDYLTAFDYLIASLHNEFIGIRDAKDPVWSTIRAIEKAYTELGVELSTERSMRALSDERGNDFEAEATTLRTQLASAQREAGELRAALEVIEQLHETWDNNGGLGWFNGVATNLEMFRDVYPNVAIRTELGVVIDVLRLLAALQAGQGEG